MRQQQPPLPQKMYVPAFSITQITTKHSLGKVLVAPADLPDHICGVARRIGYTGNRSNDLAIYRLKIKFDDEHNVVTLPGLFVVEDGVFEDYEQWNHHRSILRN